MATTLLSGYPDATTTGVQSGVALKTYNGDLVVNTPGAVISGLDIKGTVFINAPNVTIENCKITFVNYWGVNVKSGVTGTVVQNCEINGTGTSPQGVDGIQGQGTFLNNNIYNVENGIAVDGNNTVIKGNYIHDFHASGDPHYDGIQIGGALSNITISHNTIVNQQRDTGTIYISNDWGPVNGVIVDDNQLIGAGFTVYSDEKGGGSGPQINGVQFTNNKLGSGYWGFSYISNNTVVWQGNTEIGSGKTISVDGKLSSSPSSPPSSAPGLDAPVIAGWSSDTGVAGDKITNDNTVTLSGKAAANSTVKVLDGGKQIGSATADGSGAWKFTSAALNDGNHSLTATATSGGVTSSASSPLALVIDTAAPNAPTLKLSTSASNLASTHVAKLDGTAEANSTVKVFDGLTQVGTAKANSSGVWTFTTGTLADGNHNFTAQATDVAGNTGVASAALAVAVAPSTQQTAPSAPKIASFSNDSGVVGDGITNDNTLTLKGSAAANSTIKVYDGGTQIGTAKADAKGAWSFDTSALKDAKHTLTATATNAAGQTSAASAGLTVTIDTHAPGVPTIAEGSGATQLLAARAAASSSSNDKAVHLTGQAEAKSTITILDGGKKIGTTTAGTDGTWSFTADSLAGGHHAFTATATDVAGNVGKSSTVLEIDISNPAPANPKAPSIVSFSKDSGVAGDHITNDKTLTLTGSADAKSTVTVFDGDKKLGTTKADANGTWKYTTATLADGAHNLTATATDASHHTSSASSALAVTIDTTAPTAPTLAIYSSDGKALSGSTQVDDFLLKGKAEANSVVNIFDAGKQIGTTHVAKDGSWSFDTGHLADGKHSFTSTAADAAGNTSAASSAKAISIIDAPQSSSKGIDFTDVSHNWWSHSSVTIKGTADAYSQIKVYDGTKAIGTAAADADGNWTLTSSSGSSSAVKSFSAKGVDAAGEAVTSSGHAILGNCSSNKIVSTTGDDLLVGRGHSDTFVFAPNFGNDTIKDFRAKGWQHDVLQFDKGIFDSFADVLAHASQSGHDVVISTGHGDSLTLKNMKLASLDKFDFHFA